MPPLTLSYSPSRFLSLLSRPYTCINCRRALHRKSPPVPPPTPFVPDASTFLSLIGRELSKHASKFPTWESIFTLSSEQLQELGIEPARTRRYLMRWREKFRQGEFGIGGDLKYVKDGVAELRVCEVPALPSSSGDTQRSPGSEGIPNTAANQIPPPYVSLNHTPGMKKLILNTPPGSETYVLEPGQSTADLRKPKGLRLLRGDAIAGSYVQPVKGTNGGVATLRVQEGMWEHRRGHKVDGGERRKAEVRFKRRVAERKAATR